MATYGFPEEEQDLDQEQEQGQAPAQAQDPVQAQAPAQGQNPAQGQDTGVNSSGNPNPPMVPPAYGFPEEGGAAGGEGASPQTGDSPPNGGAPWWEQGSAGLVTQGNLPKYAREAGYMGPLESYDSMQDYLAHWNSVKDDFNAARMSGEIPWNAEVAAAEGWEPPAPSGAAGAPGGAPAAPAGAQGGASLPGGLENTSYTASVPQNSDIGALSRYAAEWLASPGRYDDDFVSSSMDAITARMEASRQETLNQTNAQLAARGLLSSTAGQQVMAQNLGNVSRQANEEQLALMRMVADANAQDRGMAFNAALGAAGLLEDSRQFGISTSLQERSLDLQKYGMDQDYALAVARMEQDARHFGMEVALRNRSLDLQQQGLAADQARFQARLDFDILQADRDQARWADEFGFRQDQAALDNQYRDDRFSWEQGQADVRNQQWEDEFGWRQGQADIDNQYRDDRFSWDQDEAQRYWDHIYAQAGVRRPASYTPRTGPGYGFPSEYDDEDDPYPREI